MADEELEKIRAKRMAEIQQQMSSGQREQNQRQEEIKKQEAEMKNQMLSQILDQQARARLNSIALVKPERAMKIESLLIQMASSGQIGGKIGDAQLVSLLERFQEPNQKKSTVKFNRRRLDDSDDDDI
ncbi:programmed cell death protein 5-like [Xenia sp. Carnegie-2017]|uniref:programmed cell death protein 5-like n=1 Tax=Xenia sp. Carnegie-2017 TaxID=2897299 RepID=UPI001F04D7EE|nr:programmed cell death protein 5-like [Xenia sp. Carnegie-2017]